MDGHIPGRKNPTNLEKTCIYDPRNKAGEHLITAKQRHPRMKREYTMSVFQADKETGMAGWGGTTGRPRAPYSPVTHPKMRGKSNFVAILLCKPVSKKKYLKRFKWIYYYKLLRYVSFPKTFLFQIPFTPPGSFQKTSWLFPLNSEEHFNEETCHLRTTSQPISTFIPPTQHTWACNLNGTASLQCMQVVFL